MSGAGLMRRTDKQMPASAAREFLREGHCVRVATVGPDGAPYIVPLLYVTLDDTVYVHTSQAPGRFRRNVEHCNRVCLEIDEPGEVFGYGRFECDTSISYRSVVAFGSVRISSERDEKVRFCAALMEKYAAHVPERPKGVLPRLDHIAVYAIALESLTGKEAILPARADQWPSVDRTKTPVHSS